MNPGFSCTTCVFFSAYQPYDQDRPSPRGQCRRHAPSLYQDDAGALKTAWPMVHEQSWCGEHAEIDVEEPAVAEQLPQPRPDVIVINDKPPYDGPEWRCINCKSVHAQLLAPDLCFVCRCREFVRVAQ